MTLRKFELANRRFFFFSAPPLKGARPSKRKLPNPPYKDAPPWKRSVFYFWWEYLRRHDGYKECCERGGLGKYSSIYYDFGDVHACDFWTWWRSRGQFLFSEPLPLEVKSISKDQIDGLTENEFLLSVPLTQGFAETVKQLRTVLVPRLRVQRSARKVSRALYPVAAKPILPALYQHLRIWDLRQANPDWPYHKIADAAGLLVATGSRKTARDLEANDAWTKHRKTLAVSRHLRIANTYIKNVVKGRFPDMS
jgi:hypothetical protein